MSSEKQTENKEKIVKHGVVFIIFDGEKIQLEKRLKKDDEYFGYFLIPGGKVEYGECPNATLAREIREEYAFTHIKGEELGLITSFREGVENSRHVYVVDAWKKDEKLYNIEKRNMHLAVTPAEARKLCKHPISQLILDMFDEYLLRQNSKGI